MMHRLIPNMNIYHLNVFVNADGWIDHQYEYIIYMYL